MNIAARQTNNIENATTTARGILERSQFSTFFQWIEPPGNCRRIRSHRRRSHTIAHDPKKTAAVFRLTKVEVSTSR